MNAQASGTMRPSACARTLPSARPPSDKLFGQLLPEDQVLLNKLLAEPTSHVDHEDFEKPGIETVLFGENWQEYVEGEARFVPAPPITEGVWTAQRLPSLSIQQEQKLFKRYNFACMRVGWIIKRSAGKRLTQKQTRELLAWGHRVLDTRTVIVRLNLPLVLAMAKRTRLRNIDFNDLVSEGNLALLRSIEKFDCGRGFKFSTYACRAILKSFSRVAMRMSRYRGRFPVEFDPSMEKSDSSEMKRGLVEQDCVEELKEILIKNLAKLSDVERKVIDERFAIGQVQSDDTAKPKTLEQVGNIIGVTKERVRQIQNKALRKIKGALEAQYLAA